MTKPAFTRWRTWTLIIPKLFAAQLSDYMLSVLSSLFSSASWTLCPAEAILSFFFLLPSPLHLPSTDYLSRALGSKLIRHSGTKQERTGSSLLDPTRSVFFWTVLFRTEKTLVFKKRDEDLCLLPKEKDEQGKVQGTLHRKRGLPLPMIKATIHPSIPETVLVSSYCLRVILHRAAFTIWSVRVWVINHMVTLFMLLPEVDFSGY